MKQNNQIFFKGETVEFVQSKETGLIEDVYSIRGDFDYKISIKLPNVKNKKTVHSWQSQKEFCKVGG